MTRADKWVGRRADPMASRRRWCCGVCGELHAMEHGVVCEFYQGPHRPVLWCRAAIPVSPFKDVHFLATEKCHIPRGVALLDVLDVARPLAPWFNCQAYGRDVVYPGFHM
eukprot:4409798-Alexandrium_andersonii.AAC.1